MDITTDASRMFKIGQVSERAERLVKVTEECLELGLAAAKPWGHSGDTADAINTHAQENGYSVVEEIGADGRIGSRISTKIHLSALLLQKDLRCYWFRV